MLSADLSFFDSKAYRVTLSLCISVFFICFIAFFLPFGVDNYDPDHHYDLNFFRDMVYFFLPLLVFSLLNEVILRPLIFQRSNWMKITLWSLWTLFFLSTVMFFAYNWLGNWHDFHFTSYLGFLRDVPAVLIFPMAGVFFFYRYRTLHKQVTDIILREEVPQYPEKLLEFRGSGSKDRITLAASSFLYGRSQDNYVELFYLENKEAQKFVLRATLNTLTETINDPAIIRCHRSYMVNLIHVRSIKGIKQDTTLHLAPYNHGVPVSKTYLETTMEALKKIRTFS